MSRRQLPRLARQRLRLMLQRKTLLPPKQSQMQQTPKRASLKLNSRLQRLRLKLMLPRRLLLLLHQHPHLLHQHPHLLHLLLLLHQHLLLPLHQHLPQRLPQHPHPLLPQLPQLPRLRPPERLQSDD